MRAKRVLSVLTLLLAVCIPAVAQEGGAQLKVAIVDMNRVVMESALGKASQARFEQFYQSKLNELQQEGQALERERTTLENQRSVLSEQAFTERRNDLQQRVLAFQQRQESAEREVNRLRQEETQRFIQQVIPIIQEIGRNQDYTLILDRNDDGLLFFDSSIDLTDQVLQALDSRTQGGQ